jgi:hypothetical protein
MQIYDIFPTKIMLAENIALAEELLPLCDKYTQITETNLLGIANFPSTAPPNKTLSDMVDQEPVVQRAMEYFRALVAEYETAYTPTWKSPYSVEAKFFSSMQKYSYLKQHRHLGCNYAGILYLEAGSNVPPLKIYDVNPYTTDTMQITPCQGAVVIIPWWMEHSLDQMLTDEPRKAFTFNL